MATNQAPFRFDRIDRRTKQVSPALIAAVTSRIVEHVQPELVILFGSQARGDAEGDSDIDLLVILSSDHALAALQHRDRARKIRSLFGYRLFGLDVIVPTTDEVRELQETNEGEWELILEILEEGETLYDRAEETHTERTHPTTDARMVSESRIELK